MLPQSPPDPPTLCPSAPVGALELRGGEIVDKREPAKRTRLAALERLQKRGVIVGVGYRGPK
jgi:hypothetical protein